MKYFDPFEQEWQDKPFPTQRHELSWLLKKMAVLKNEMRYIRNKTPNTVVFDPSDTLEYDYMNDDFDEHITNHGRYWIPKKFSQRQKMHVKHLITRLGNIIRLYNEYAKRQQALGGSLPVLGADDMDSISSGSRA